MATNPAQTTSRANRKGALTSRGMLFIALAVLACFVLALRGGAARSTAAERPRAQYDASASSQLPPRPARRAARGDERPACAAADPALVQDPASAAKVATSLSAFTALFHEHLPETQSYAELRKCPSYTSDNACKTHLTDALYEVMDMHGMPAILSGAVDIRDLGRYGSDAVYSNVQRVLGESSDPVERVAVLIAIQSIPVRAQALPKAAYDGLAQKPAIEAQLLLQHNRLVPIDDPDLLRESRYLAGASGVDSRVQDAALSALASAGAAVELASAVRELATAHDAAWSGWRGAVAPALGRCGQNCAEAIDELFRNGVQRDVAANLLRSMDPTARVEALAHLSSRIAPEMTAQLARETDIEQHERE